MLAYLLSQCKDYIEQKTDLEQLCDEISADIPNFVSVLFTPKSHCELAGKGIEYSWGASKRYYRRQSITMKRSTLNFEKLVKNSVNKVSTMMCRRFPESRGGICLDISTSNCKEKRWIRVEIRMTITKKYTRCIAAIAMLTALMVHLSSG